MTTQYTFSDELFSDLHKDAYGFRPDDAEFEIWNAFTPEEKQAAWDVLIKDLREEERRRDQIEQKMIVKFEQEVADRVAKSGREHLAEILLMIEEANPYHKDPGYLAYVKGLPYNYFRLKYDLK